MNLKHASRRNSIHWIDGIGINIGSDGIARNVPAAIAEKLLVNHEMWSRTDEGGSVAPGTVINIAEPAKAPAAAVVEVLVPESLALLEGRTLDEIAFLASTFEAGAVEDVKQGARAILAAADVQLATQLARMLREKDAPAAPAIDELTAPVAEVAPEAPAEVAEAETPAEAAPDAMEGVQGATEADPGALVGVPVIEAGKRKPGPKPKTR